MKRHWLALIPWMASAAHGQTTPAVASWTYAGDLKGSAFRIGDECYASISGLKAAGWKIRVTNGKAIVREDGETFTSPTRMIDGELTIPLRRAIETLGGIGQWDSEDHFSALAVIETIDLHRDRVNLTANLRVRPKISLYDSPQRLIFDFPGAVLKRPGDFHIDEGCRIGQFRSNTVRLVVESDEPFQSPDEALSKATKSLTWRFRSTQESDDAHGLPVPQVPRQAPDDGSSAGVIPPTQATGAPTVRVGAPRIVAETSDSLILSIPATGGSPLSKIVRQEPTLLEVEFTGADLNLPADFKLDSPSVRSIAVRREGDGAILSLRTRRPMGIELSNSPGEVVLRLAKPNVGDGKLAGKVIVIDPGHGGHDTGAKSPDGSLLEKDMNLAIAAIVAERLEAEGATVLMTRKTDEFIPLPDRPAVANRNKADFFISIHINSNSIANKISGGATYYHMGSTTSQILAQTLQHEIAIADGLPSFGGCSDRELYRTGLSVLRHCERPAVLIECGFISNDKDRATMITEEFRQNVATGIVKGLRLFVGEDDGN